MPGQCLTLLIILFSSCSHSGCVGLLLHDTVSSGSSIAQPCHCSAQSFPTWCLLIQDWMHRQHAVLHGLSALIEHAVTACYIMARHERSLGMVSSLVAVTIHKYQSCRCIEGTSRAQGLDETLQETATPEQYKLFMSGYCAKCLNLCSCSWAAPPTSAWSSICLVNRP